MACIAALLGVLVGPATEIGKCILPPIKRQFSYLCCFSRNSESFKDEIQKLDDARKGLEMGVAAAENNAEVIVPEVKSWLESATKTLSEVNGIKDGISLQQKGNFITNWRSRYSLSKKAKKMAETITQLRDKCKFDRISQPGPPAAASNYVNVDGIIDFESRRKIKVDIISSLKDENISIVGIYGMGGVGKTTMAKKIMEMVKRDNLFDEVPMAVVGQALDVLKIQNQLMEQLGLDSKKFETTEAKAHELRTRLTSTKRILVVLDDLWQRIDLKDVGIPFQSGLAKCKVILTTRNHRTLIEMDAKTYEMKSMSDTEAWDLFKKTVGDSFYDKPDLAKDVVKECKGLPLALVIIGSHLKGKQDVRHWNDALWQLKRASPRDIPEVLGGVYNPLKLSYDGLGSKNARSLFLLCGVFPEDHDISLEDLFLDSLIQGYGCATVVANGPTSETLSTNTLDIIWEYSARAYPFTAERLKEIEAADDKMAEGWPPQMKIDKFHVDELLLTKLVDVFCDYYCKTGGLWLYYCRKCNFGLHKDCATEI